MGKAEKYLTISYLIFPPDLNVKNLCRKKAKKHVITLEIKLFK